MSIRADLTDEIVAGLQGIRSQFKVPGDFPGDVTAAAEAAAQRKPAAAHVDRTQWPFVTLDPATSTDLDQAFHIEMSGSDIMLHYAIADVAWFVDDGDPVGTEAWQRGMTQYLPDGKAGLYPPVLAEGAASLLPDGDRPAVVFQVRVGSDGACALAGAERSVIRSHAKLAYESVRPAQLPPALSELGRRVSAAEDARGAARIEPQEQVVRLSAGAGPLSGSSSPGTR